jgi:hypothetical protein
MTPGLRTWNKNWQWVATREAAWSSRRRIVSKNSCDLLRMEQLKFNLVSQQNWPLTRMSTWFHNKTDHWPVCYDGELLSMSQTMAHHPLLHFTQYFDERWCGINLLLPIATDKEISACSLDDEHTILNHRLCLWKERDRYTSPQNIQP